MLAASATHVSRPPERGGSLENVTEPGNSSF